MSNLVPNATETEKALLGSILTYPEIVQQLLEMDLSEQHFFSPVHKIIYKAIVDLYEQTKFVDFVTLLSFLEDSNQANNIGGIDYLSQLLLNSATKEIALRYAVVIMEKAQLRKLIEQTKEINTLATSNKPMGEILSKAEEKILAITRYRASTDFISSKELAGQVLQDIRLRAAGKNQKGGLLSGFSLLDKLTNGFQRGDLILLAARPSVGKTALALNLAVECARNNHATVAIFSLEMPAQQLIMRMMSAKSRVEADKLKTGQNISEEQWNSLSEATKILMDLNIFIDDSSMTKISDIFSKCRKLQVDYGLDFVVIDYIQLINSSNPYENRQQEVSLISRNLKMLARELNVPVLALSQLSRGVEQRVNKRPMLSDLRESGALEQDADLVMMLYRDLYYEDIETRTKNSRHEKIEVNLVKHRNGPVGQVNLSFDAAINRFTTMTDAPDPQ